jgi:hypothetical protein
VSRADDGYAAIFYGGAEDISHAQAAHLTPGSDAGGLNIYLRDSARFKIRGQVLPPASGTRIVVAPKGSDLTDAGYFIQPNASGAFEIRGVSPGSYVLLATADGGALSSDVICAQRDSQAGLSEWTVSLSISLVLACVRTGTKNH